MQYTDYLIEFIEYLKHGRRLSAQTIGGYSYCIRKFLEFVKKSPEKIVSKDIMHMLQHLSEKGMRNSSIANYIVAMRCFFNWLHYVNKTEKTEDISFFLNKIVRSSSQQTIPQCPLNEEIDRIRACLHAFKNAFSFNKESLDYKLLLRDLAAIEIFRATGMRSGELKHVQVQDIDLEAKTVLVKKGKGNRQRLSIFGDEVKEAIREYIAAWELSLEEHLFFFTRFNIFYNIIKRWAMRAGINPNIHPHSFRHYHITKAQRDGVPTQFVSDQVGHVNLNTTRRYTHFDHEYRREKYAVSELQK